MQEGQAEAVQVLAAYLASLELRPESLWAIRQAAMAAEMEGVGGSLVLKIPRRLGAQVDAQFTTGSAQITLDF